MTRKQFFTQVICWFKPHEYKFDKVEDGKKYFLCENCGKERFLQKRFFTDKSKVKKG